MFRLLAAMLLLAGLMLGQSGYGSIADTDLVANGSALTAMHGESGARGQSEGHQSAPSPGCHHSSCSQTFLVKADLVPVRASARSGALPAVNDRHARSIILERDPPIPRSLI
jgi:hypothetical protein